MSPRLHWRRTLLAALATVGFGVVEYVCVLSASTLEERCFATALLVATALAIGLASRRVWFGMFCSAALYGLIWASSSLKFEYLAVPAIAPDLYYFFSLDTVKVVADYPLLALACLALVAGIPLLLWLAWHSDSPVNLAHYPALRRSRWRRLGLAGCLLFLGASLTPHGLFAGVFGKPMWIAVNDQSFITNFLTSFYDTQITIPPPAATAARRGTPSQ